MAEVYKQAFEDVKEAQKLLGSADNFIHVLLPAIKDNKLILRAFECLSKATVLTISSVLKVEYVNKRINLTRDPKKNLAMFFGKCAFRYGIGNEDVKIIKEIIILGRKHKESGLEFSKSGRIIIMDDDFGTNELSLEKMNDFLRVVRQLLDNTNRNFEELFRKVFKVE